MLFATVPQVSTYLESGHVDVCASSWLGEAVATGQAECPPCGIGQGRQVPDRYKDRFDTGSRTKHAPYFPVHVAQTGVASAIGAGGTVVPAQKALCYSNGWQAATEPEMTGQSEPAWMGQALSITDDQIRIRFKLVQGLEDTRYFTKTEQTRKIRECAFKHGMGRFDGFHRTRIDGNCTCQNPFPAVEKRAVRTDDTSDVTGKRHIPDATGQAFLQGNGLPRGEIPTVSQIIQIQRRINCLTASARAWASAATGSPESAIREKHRNACSYLSCCKRISPAAKPDRAK